MHAHSMLYYTLSTAVEHGIFLRNHRGTTVPGTTRTSDQQQGLNSASQLGGCWKVWRKGEGGEKEEGEEGREEGGRTSGGKGEA